MDIPAHRQAIRQAFALWLNDWQNPGQADLFSADVALFSNQHGQAEGIEAVQHAFADDRSHQIAVYVLNHYIAGNEHEAAASAYVYGHLNHNGQTATFNGRAVLQFIFSDGHWRIRQIRLQLYPDRGRIDSWPNDAGSRRWHSGQATAAIISELDSPWALFPQNRLPGSDIEQIHELYARYAWGIDLADWALLKSSFHADAHTDLMPMGERHGLREIYGQLRGFREAANELWHAATALDIRFSNDGNHAEILLGRTIAEQAFTADGQPLYGAHYNARAVRDSDGIWRYSFFEYKPGWFTYPQAV